jgi:hypothetical protein
MPDNIRWAVLSCVLAAFAGGASAQSSSAAVPAGPVPVQIASDKRVFVSNMGTYVILPSDKDQLEDRPYNEFYAALKAWGRYQLVDTPGDADLVFEIGFIVPPGSEPQLRLRIVDAKTHFRLWTIFDPVRVTVRTAKWDKNFAEGITNLVNDLKKLSVRAEASAQHLNK